MILSPRKEGYWQEDKKRSNSDSRCRKSKGVKKSTEINISGGGGQ